MERYHKKQANRLDVVIGVLCNMHRAAHLIGDTPDVNYLTSLIETLRKKKAYHERNHVNMAAQSRPASHVIQARNPKIDI